MLEVHWNEFKNTSYNDNIGGWALKDSYNPVDISPNNADSDLTSSYPSNQMLCNGSRFTTYTETIGISRVDDEVAKRAGLSLVAGKQNLVSYAIDVYNLPRLDQVLDLYVNNKP